MYGRDRVGIRFSPNSPAGEIGSPDYRQTFKYAIEAVGKVWHSRTLFAAQFYYVSMLSQKDIAYVHVIDGISYGFHSLGEPFTLREARKVLPAPVVLIGNGGYVSAFPRIPFISLFNLFACRYTPESANDRIESGDADMISFGRSYLGNPDLPERVANGWPLADPPARSFWNTPNETYMTPQGYIMPCFNPKECDIGSTTSH